MSATTTNTSIPTRPIVCMNCRTLRTWPRRTLGRLAMLIAFWRFSKKTKRSEGNEKRRRNSGSRIELRKKDLTELPEERKKNVLKNNKKVIRAKVVLISHHRKNLLIKNHL